MRIDLAGHDSRAEQPHNSARNTAASVTRRAQDEPPAGAPVVDQAPAGPATPDRGFHVHRVSVVECYQPGSVTHPSLVWRGECEAHQWVGPSQDLPDLALHDVYVHLAEAA